MRKLKKSLKKIKMEIIEKEKKSRKNIKPIYSEPLNSFDSCLCTDRNYQFKKLYPTEKEAEKRAKFLFDEQGVYLIVYPCPYSLGWHLTKY